MLESFQGNKTPPRQASQASTEARILTRKTNAAAQYASFERKPATVARETGQQVVKKSEKAQDHELERIRKWQKHYQEIFPTFVFYFESVPEDLRIKYTKQVVALGAVCCLPIMCYDV
jgi:regulatory subunit for Cdc7p protein kinase